MKWYKVVLGISEGNKECNLAVWTSIKLGISREEGEIIWTALSKRVLQYPVHSWPLQPADLWLLPKNLSHSAIDLHKVALCYS